MTDTPEYMPIMANSYRAAEDIASLRLLGATELVVALPWAMIAPHDAQARSNHGGQSLIALAGRGGLGPCEAVAILEDRRHSRMDAFSANARLIALKREHEAATVVLPPPTDDALISELLTCLAEECCEVGQRVSKVQRFGLRQKQTGQPYDNAQRVVRELHDLISVAQLLEDLGVLKRVMPDDETKVEKLAKIVRNMSIKITGVDPAPLADREDAELAGEELDWMAHPVSGGFVGIDRRTGRIVRTREDLPASHAVGLK